MRSIFAWRDTGEMNVQHERPDLQLMQTGLVDYRGADKMDSERRNAPMKIQYYQEASLKEDYVAVHFREETEQIRAVRSFFSSFKSITGKKEDGVHKLYPGSIYYLEVVDRKLFAYQEKEVYQLEDSLQHFLNCFAEQGFVRIGKSTAVNLYKVGRIKGDLNMRLRLYMDNGEMLILNRTYKKTFMEALRRMQEATYENHQ